MKVPPRRAHLAAVLLGVVLVLPAVRAGFFADDYLQLAQLEGWSANGGGPLDLYSFVPPDHARVAEWIHRGALPWFTAPGLELSFWRPLTSGLMAVDHALFGRWAVPYHLDTLLWYAALLAVAGALLRRAAPPSLWLLALLIFCLDDGHAMAVLFTAARNAILSCLFAWLALGAHLRWRIHGWRAGAWLAPLLGALGLAAGELGLGALAYVAAWELCERRPGWRRALAPAALLVAGYLIAYRVAGAGAHASGTYLDPFGDPLGFLAALPARVALLLGNLILRTPIDAAIFDERLRAPLVAVGAGVAVVLALWLPGALRRLPAGEAARVRWWGLGAAAALLAATPGLTGERLLFAASLGASVVVAALLRDAWQLLRARRRRVLAVLGLAALGLPNVALAVVALPAKTIFFDQLFAGYRRLARDAQISSPVPAGVVVVALDDLFSLQMLEIRAVEQGRPPAQLRQLVRGQVEGLPRPDTLGARGATVLSMAATAHRLRRTAADTLELSTPDGTMMDGVWPATLRAPSLPLPRGTVIRTAYMTATVLDDRAGAPTRVAFRFDRSLDDPSLIFLTLARGEMRRLALPPVGGELALPRTNVLEAVRP